MNSVENVRRAALQAFQNTKPTGIYYGTVINVNPLEIKLSQKIILDSQMLILSSLVQDFSVNMTVDHTTENHTHNHTLPGYGTTTDETHKHDYSGQKTFQVHLGLNVGEKVILVRVQGGQKFLVLDRIRNNDTSND